MSTTVLGIYNAALSAAHARGRLSALTDASVEREECDIWYDLIRDRVMEAAYWPGCRTTSRLALLKERDQSANWLPGDPETEFLYSYALPADYLRAWHLVSFERFSISFDSSNNRQILSTNAVNAVLIYAFRQNNPVFWTPGQRESTVYALAAAVAGAIMGDMQIVQKNYQLADERILAARSHANNAQNMMPEATPPSLQARGWIDNFRTKYYYPHGPMFVEAVPNAS